jgi:hypothetical protein
MAKGDVIDTLIAEAIGEGDEGLAAVAWTIMNRAAETGRTPAQVVSDPGDYTGASNPGSATKKAMKDPAIRAKVEKVWSQVQSGSIPDPTGGATHYWAPNGMKGGKAPYWAKSETSDAGRLKIGNHVFLPKQSPNSALSAINAAAPQPMPSRPTALAYAPSASVPRPPSGSYTLPPPALDLNPPLPPRASNWQETGGPPMRGDIPMPRPRPTPPAPARGVGTSYLAPATKVSTLRIDPLTNKVIPSAPLTRTPVTAQAPAPRPVSKPPNVTYVPSTPAPTPFQTANRTMVQGVPFVGPIVNGVVSAVDLVSNRPSAAAQAKPAPQPVTLPSVIPPTPKGYNTLTGKYEAMQPSTPYLAGPAPVRTTDNKYQGRILPVVNAPTMAETMDEQALMRRGAPKVALPRLPMNPTPALIASRAPRNQAPPMPRPRPVMVQQQRQVQPPPQQQSSGGLLGILLGGGGLASLLSGGVQKTNPNITYTDPGIVNPGSGKEINGIDIAFMPKAVQQSSRWNTGY